MTSLPRHLAHVRKEHLPKLNGYSLRYLSEGNGACANNSVAVAIHEDEDEGPKVKRKTLDHMADHYSTYYMNKIGLPYVETVGVGEHSKTVTKTTDEQMIEFLKSEEAMTVFSDAHELLAMANMYNIRIHVFTYGGTTDGWNTVHPDPEMVSLLGSSSGLKLPDVSLYHSYNNHYDLLVERESRIAQLGLVAGSQDDSFKDNTKEVIDISSDEWTTVNRKQSNTEGRKSNEENLLNEMDIDEDGKKDINEEIVLAGSKKNGYKRTSPWA